MQPFLSHFDFKAKFTILWTIYIWE
ncbi:hypothetical protein TSAR_002207 [Trichomalopsis sarcophagae]|uniref:Uncharacterized protein n=1 Tax=Trichomalopsis sarcophagae TaxID=543379 RepID=A0A232FF74_9HYME|nr:hypothetical protein TSAR_002207 [Trichomalopsis sarcophagae]